MNKWLKTPDVDGRYHRLSGIFKPPSQRFSTLCQGSTSSNRPRGWRESSTNSTTSHSWPRKV